MFFFGDLFFIFLFVFFFGILFGSLGEESSEELVGDDEYELESSSNSSI